VTFQPIRSCAHCAAPCGTHARSHDPQDGPLPLPGGLLPLCGAMALSGVVERGGEKGPVKVVVFREGTSVAYVSAGPRG